jgi:hypothetical protein
MKAWTKVQSGSKCKFQASSKKSPCGAGIVFRKCSLKKRAEDLKFLWRKYAVKQCRLCIQRQSQKPPLKEFPRVSSRPPLKLESLIRYIRCSENPFCLKQVVKKLDIYHFSFYTYIRVSIYKGKIIEESIRGFNVLFSILEGAEQSADEYFCR